MTYQATHIPEVAQAPLLRRPSGTERGPVTKPMARSGSGDLPAFLKAPAALNEYWSENEGPVRITDFDPRQHILTLEFESGAPMPELSIETDEDHAVSALMANGKPMALLYLDDIDFTMDHVAITHGGD